jgi:hypothetical protein
MNTKKERLKGLHVDNKSFHDVKCLVAHVSKYQVSVKLFYFATIAMKSWNLLTEDIKVEVDETWATTLAWDLNTILTQSHVLPS